MFDLAIAELRALNPGRGADAFDGRNAAQAREPLWGDSADCSPRALELVDLGDQREDFGRNADRREIERFRHFIIHFHPINLRAPPPFVYSFPSNS